MWLKYFQMKYTYLKHAYIYLPDLIKKNTIFYFYFTLVFFIFRLKVFPHLSSLVK